MVEIAGIKSPQSSGLITKWPLLPNPISKKNKKKNLFEKTLSRLTTDSIYSQTSAMILQGHRPVND